MRLLPTLTNLTLPTLMAALAVTAGTGTAAQAPSLRPVELVRQTVANEIKASKSTTNYMFHERRETPRGSETKLMVETRDAMAGIVVAYNDKPLTKGQRQGEFGRVGRFLKDPEELKKKQKQEKENEERITRIMKALPDAFLYEADGTEAGSPGVGKPGGELVRLKFRPNPDYDSPSRIEQVLTAMQGYMLIDAGQGRIAKIDGTLANDVSFGWGILGHLDHGGRFQVEQGHMDNGDWEITRMTLDFTGKILIFKSIVIKSTEVYSDFHPVPPDLTFAQGLELLKKQVATLAENEPQNGKAQSK